MGQSRVFFPRRALDVWLSGNEVELTDRELVIKAAGLKYRIVEAVRIVGEVSGLADPHEIVGKVKSVAFVTELGAELLETSMILGDNAYDVVPGFVGTKAGSLDEHERTAGEPVHGTGPDGDVNRSDEELLLRFLQSKLGR